MGDWETREEAGPPGYRIIGFAGLGWQSYRWVLTAPNGVVVQSRSYSSLQEATEAAWSNYREAN